jgi:hypothetical protein
MAIPVQEGDDDGGVVIMVRVRNLPFTGFDPFAFLFDSLDRPAARREVERR